MSKETIIGILAFRSGPAPSEPPQNYLTPLVHKVYPEQRVRVRIWRIIGVAEETNESRAFDLYNKLRLQGQVPHLGWEADKRVTVQDAGGTSVVLVVFELYPSVLKEIGSKESSTAFLVEPV